MTEAAAVCFSPTPFSESWISLLVSRPFVRGNYLDSSARSCYFLVEFSVELFCFKYWKLGNSRHLEWVDP